MSFSRSGSGSAAVNGSSSQLQQPAHGRRAVQPAAGSGSGAANFSQAPRPPQRASSLRGSSVSVSGAAAASGASTAAAAASASAPTTTTSGNNTPRRRGSNSGAAPGFAAATFASSTAARAGSLRPAAAASRANRNPDSSDDGDDDPQPGPLWVALKENKIYTAPNGAQVGEAAAGTVIEEHRSHTDMFGATWIAAMAASKKGSGGGEGESGTSDSNEGDEESLVWVRQYERGDNVGLPREALWRLQPQAGEEDSAAGAAAASSSSSSAPAKAAADPNSVICNPAVAPFKINNADPSAYDFALIQSYWKSVASAAGGNNSSSNGSSAMLATLVGRRDWNTEYQTLIERLLFGAGGTDAGAKEEAADDVRQRIHRLYTDFAQEIEDAVETIVGELAAPLAQRKIKGFVRDGSGGGSPVLGVYFHNNIMYRLNLDSSGVGGDKNAMKIASEAFRAHCFVGTVAPLYFLHQPLVMVMTYRGFRVTASSIPPLRPAPEGLVAGSPDGGNSWLRPEGGFLNAIFDECAEQLGLAPHQIKAVPIIKNGAGATPAAAAAATSITVAFPADSAIFAGWDNRLYWLNTARVLPPLAPVKAHSEYATPAAAANSALFRRLRPELLSRLAFRLSSDAFVPNASHVEDNEDVNMASSLLRDDAVPSVAAVLGFLEPTLAATLTLDACAACGKPVEGHIVFSVCQADCCKICPQCNLSIAKTAFWDGDFDAAEKKVKDIVAKKCTGNSASGSGGAKTGGVPRTLKGFSMFPDVTAIMHAHGVNMRYLNLVYQRIPRSAFHSTAHYVEIEMICRTAKHLLSALLRKAPDTDAANRETANFFLALLQPSGAQAERFWAEELGPAIMAKFEVTSPFDTGALDRDLVYRRLSELTGVTFSPASVRSLLTDAPFVQMLPPRPVLKQIHIPYLVEAAGERREYLDRFGGLMQVFWSDVPESEAEAAAWASRRPAHMKHI